MRGFCLLVLPYCKIGIWGLNYNLLLAWETCLLFSDEVRAKGFISYVHAANYLQFGTDGNVRMSISDIGNVGIGVFAGNHKLEVCGTIRSHEWIVELFGCDFVFDKNYSLPTYQQRKDFIKYNGHLMYIQSANEMQKEGAEMASTTMGILRNVEEHELYLFKHEEQIAEQDEKIRLLQEKNDDLEKELGELIMRLEKLEYR
ncbi:MAG: hypothetical protein COB88_10470 [Flavobacteriales bacterium]|nr:MAG: hypothetical protein COB88_10470 [Flavobacteriales bacterium]